ncbi:MAG: hypothetical protein AAF986_08270 [Pseudomonadota bacterium]
MAEPVCVQIQLADLEKILGIWQECAEDLKASVDAEYANRMDYPSEARRHKRDVEPAVLSLSMIPAFRIKYGVEKFER